MASLVGTVKAVGLPISNARIDIYSNHANTQSVYTNIEGKYSFTGLALTEWTVSIPMASSAFIEGTITSINITEEKQYTLDIDLGLSNLSKGLILTGGITTVAIIVYAIKRKKKARR